MKDKSSSLNVIKYFTDGLTEVVASFLYVFKLGGVGIKTLVLLPSKVLFNASSSKVDKVYKNTKVLMDNAVNTAVNMPKEATEQKEEATETLDMDVKPVPEVQTVQEQPESFLAKAWKVLNGDLGQNKSKSQIAKLEEKKRLLQEELASPEAKRNTEAKVYTYVAKTPGGKWVDGRFIGFSKMDVNSFLLNEGYEVYSIENNKMIDFIYKGQSKMKM